MKRFLWLMALVLLFGADHNEYIDGPGFTQEQLEEFKKKTYVERIVMTYKADPVLAESVVDLAFKYGNDNFPTAQDILAIISIESSFRPHVKSKLKRDAAVGLTQIRPRVWKHLIPAGALTSIENQVKYSSMILTQYYNILGDEKHATNAYNVGLTSHRRGKWNPRYEAKFAKAKQLFM